MSNYTKATNFTAKDALPAGNSSKVVKGAELDTEFTAIAAAVASKSDSNSPTFTGTPLAPTAAGGTNNTQIATTAFATTVATTAAAAAFPVGGIIIWSGSVASIPSGWALCNGSNGTPDLRDRFVVGAGSTYAVGNTGGSASVTLTSSQIPSHTHTFSGTTSGQSATHTHAISISDPGHTHVVPLVGDIGGNNGNSLAGTGANISPTATTNSRTTGITASAGNASADHNHTYSGTTSATGGGSSHENRPPYYALAYIMKTA